MDYGLLVISESPLHVLVLKQRVCGVRERVVETVDARDGHLPERGARARKLKWREMDVVVNIARSCNVTNHRHKSLFLPHDLHPKRFHARPGPKRDTFEKLPSNPSANAVLSYAVVDTTEAGGGGHGASLT